MRVSEALEKDKPTLSFEFFPPKTADQEEKLFAVISTLKKFNPDFVSVTYGAMGNTREKSFFWVKEIKDRFKLDPVAHLTCVAATKRNIEEQIDELTKMGVLNILALRGDVPQEEKDFVPPENGFHYARDLVAFIKRHKPKICLGVAGCPEGHPAAPSLELDTQYLKEKIDAGADYVITQLFFDNRYYFDFLDRSHKAGIRVPIIPGIMLITSLNQMRKMTEICGATIPPKLLERLEKYGDDKKSIAKLGVEHAIAQCEELLEAEVPGLHFFVMNKSGPIAEVLTSFRQQRFQESE
ncbi:MAG: methylenetetrahydrofolate reductase [NAD(P)H] [Candidatus Saganbacteria bacterium]|nr:methylenetetrahydrofolate reductase [NAD(P)H] [Candidatus Saganbacteria bacterium]